MIEIAIPTPPSTNALFINRKGGRGKTLSSAYVAWRDEAGWLINTAKPRRIVGPVSVHITLPKTMRGDPDNRVKATLDFLVRHQLIDDDNAKTVRLVTVGLADRMDALVTVKPWGEQ